MPLDFAATCLNPLDINLRHLEHVADEVLMLFIDKPGPGTALSVAVDAGLPFILDLLDVFNSVGTPVSRSTARNERRDMLLRLCVMSSVLQWASC